MKLARVIGTVVATVKTPGLEGEKLMVIQPLNDDLSHSGEAIVAIDTVRSGPNELVYWIGGREATLPLHDTFVPVDATIVGIVDHVNTV